VAYFELRTMQEARKAQGDFSSDKYPTLWKAIPVLERVIKRWTTMSTTPRFTIVREGIEAAIQKLVKYYRHVENNVLYFAAMGKEQCDYPLMNYNADIIYQFWILVKKDVIHNQTGVMKIMLR
jgi:hypothetical protein